jgi:methylenetetrahydrofolate dehydrogenase (NADP+)/methenyltetrahydrofolate cyclohydrolase
MTIIDGKAIAAQIRESLKARIETLKQKGVTPGLSVVLVGDDPASATYVRSKERACEDLGIFSIVHRLSADTTQEQLVALVHELNADKRLHGILIQSPIPAPLDELALLREVDPDKDVDGLHVVTAGRLMVGEPGFKPCTPKGIIHLIKTTGTAISGKRAVVVGRSNMVGKPVALMLLEENATVTICHSRTQNLAAVCAEADILVAAVGRPGLITGDFVKPGALVIDVGTTRVDGKLKGDVVFDEAAEKASFITPVPGGVGTVTSMILLNHVIKAMKLLQPAE